MFNRYASIIYILQGKYNFVSTMFMFSSFFFNSYVKFTQALQKQFSAVNREGGGRVKVRGGGKGPYANSAFPHLSDKSNDELYSVHSN